MVRSIRQGQQQILTTVWMTYSAYYLCRLNFGQVQADLAAARGLHELDLGRILFAFTVCYIFGQLISGVLCDRIGARAVAAAGAFGSAAMCAVLPLIRGPAYLIVVWGANGLFQSMGFSPCVRALANWIEPSRRGWVNGLFAVSFQIGHVAAWMLAAAMAQKYDWRFAFWVPAGILAAVAVFALLRLVDAPEDVGLSLDTGDSRGAASDDPASAPRACATRFPRGAAMKATLRSGRVWLAGLGASFVSIAVYGLIFWLPHYLQKSALGASQVTSALRAILFPLAGGAGALLVGWISDRWLGGRRMLVIVSCSVLGGIFVWVFGFLSAVQHPVSSAVALALAGLFLLAAQLHIVGTLAMDLGGPAAAGSATGIINALSNLGALAAAMGTAAIVDKRGLGWGWEWVFPLWALSCFVGAGILALLWRRENTPA